MQFRSTVDLYNFIICSLQYSACHFRAMGVTKTMLIGLVVSIPPCVPRRRPASRPTCPSWPASSSPLHYTRKPWSAPQSWTCSATPGSKRTAGTARCATWGQQPKATGTAGSPRRCRWPRRSRMMMHRSPPAAAQARRPCPHHLQRPCHPGHGWMTTGSPSSSAGQVSLPASPAGALSHRSRPSCPAGHKPCLPAACPGVFPGQGAGHQSCSDHSPQLRRRGLITSEY